MALLLVMLEKYPSVLSDCVHVIPSVEYHNPEFALLPAMNLEDPKSSAPNPPLVTFDCVQFMPSAEYHSPVESDPATNNPRPYFNEYHVSFFLLDWVQFIPSVEYHNPTELELLPATKIPSP